MIAKNLNYFNIGMSNLQYIYLGQAQEFSQRTLTNMGYFWDINCRTYYFRMGKNGTKIYNFDDPVEFGDAAAETHMVDDQRIGTSHDVLKGDDFMQDVTH